MVHPHKRNGVLFSFLLTACAAVGGSPGDLHRSSWADPACYRGMKEDVEHLAAGPVVDCGFITGHTDPSFDTQVRDCARQAMTGSQGFAFGFVGVGEDSWFCSVAVRSADGQLWDLYYDSDVTGQMGRNGDHSAIWLSRCDSIEPMPEIARTGNFFRESGCKGASDVLQRLASQRKRN